MPEVLTRADPDDSVEKLSGLHHPCRDCDREHLESEVVEKAKAWRELRLTPAETRPAIAELMDALDDLIYFESKQETK